MVGNGGHNMTKICKWIADNKIWLLYGALIILSVVIYYVGITLAEGYRLR